LARREHSALELARKLRLRGYDEASVTSLIATLHAEGFQSDDRFADSYVHNRIEKGYGPYRITQELRERGIHDDLIQNYLDRFAEEWPRHAARARKKRFGGKFPVLFGEQARQSRFLEQRGFNRDLIRKIFKTGDE
jgi:Uncharacterized protein conserved in bacteria